MVECIAALRASGVSATSINTYLRGLKAYVRWLHAESVLASPFPITFLKVEAKIPATLSATQVERLVAFRPAGVIEKRTHVATLETRKALQRRPLFHRPFSTDCDHRFHVMSPIW